MNLSKIARNSCLARHGLTHYDNVILKNDNSIFTLKKQLSSVFYKMENKN